jgi:chromosome segregation ATPase
LKPASQLGRWVKSHENEGQAMRDNRNDLQDRASLLEEQINAAEAQFDKLVEQVRTEHEGRLEDLRAEFEAVSRLLEVEQRRLANIPVTSAPVPKPQPQPRVQAPSPQQHTPVHQQQMHELPHAPQAQPHAQQARSYAQQAQSYAQRPEPHVQQAQPHTQQQQPPVQQAQPQQPLTDFLVRQLSEQGAMSRDDLRRLAVQEGYFNDADTAERGVHAALVSVNKAGLIRQLPNGNFAPATVMDTIRLRRAI